MYSRKEYHVVAILSDTELIINAGRNNHVQLNSAFDILEDKDDILKDPITGEILDKFKRKKQRVYVKYIKPNYCICTSLYKKESNKPYAIQSLIEGNKLISETVGKKLNVDKSEINNIISKYSYSKIHVGDKVEIV